MTKDRKKIPQRGREAKEKSLHLKLAILGVQYGSVGGSVQYSGVCITVQLAGGSWRCITVECKMQFQSGVVLRPYITELPAT